MPTYTPTWETIVSAFLTVLGSSSAIANTSNGYPLDAINEDNLVWAVVREPELQVTGFSFGAVNINYVGQINILTDVIRTDAPRLTSAMINTCTETALKVQLDLATREARRLTITGTKTVTYAELGNAEIGRFSPYSGDNRYSYAGVSLPYRISMQYTTN